MKFPLSSEDVSELTGATLRQLQFYDEKGIVAPLKIGQRRKWDRLDVLKVLLLVELRQRTIGLMPIRKILVKFAASERINRARLTNWLVCDKTGRADLHFGEDDAVASCCRGGPCLLVDVERLRERMVS